MGQSEQGAQPGNSYSVIMERGTRLVILAFFMAYIDPCSSSCAWKSSGGTRVTVNEGEVTRVRPTTVEICANGSIKIRKKSDVGPDYPLACSGCKRKGRVICKGEMIEDLYTWWFETKCSGGRLKGVARSWLEVSRDKRYKGGRG